MQSKGLHGLLSGGTGAGWIQCGLISDGALETGTCEWSVQETWVRIATYFGSLEPLLELWW